MARFPNLEISQLPQVQTHGATGPVQGNVAAGANMRPAAPASGGATGGLGANPARNGMPPVRGTGAGQVPNAAPGRQGGGARSHALTLASLTHLQSIGHAHPNHHAIRSQAHAGLAAGKAAAPKAGRGFGALGGAGGSVKTAGGLLSSQAPSNIPGASSGAQGGSPVAQAGMTVPNMDDV